MLVKYTMVNAASGSTGGLTAARNRGGNYWRSRVVPINPESPAQSEVRLNLAAAASNWSAITQPQRDAWNTYAESLAGNNRVGDSSKPSGINAFVSTNSLRLLANLSQLSDAPSSTGRGTYTPPSTLPSYSISGPDLTIDITLTDSWAATANGVLFAFVGNKVSNGTSYYKGPYRLAAFQVRGGSAPADPLVLSTDDLGLGLGDKCFMRIHTMDSLGRVQTPFRSPLLVVA